MKRNRDTFLHYNYHVNNNNINKGCDNNTMLLNKCYGLKDNITSCYYYNKKVKTATVNNNRNKSIMKKVRLLSREELESACIKYVSINRIYDIAGTEGRKEAVITFLLGANVRLFNITYNHIFILKDIIFIFIHFYINIFSFHKS